MPNEIDQVVELLLPNEYADISKTDFFNTKAKADMLKNFLMNYSKYIKKSKMIALYGRWGSGKTSVIQNIAHNLNNGDFKSIVFEAWKYENDDNIIASFIDVISKIEPSESSICNEYNMAKIKRTLVSFFKGTLKSISIQKHGTLFDVEIDTDKVVSEVEKNGVLLQKSYNAEIEEVKNTFKLLENYLLHSEQKLIVFIDDLDRCEPENILKLISAIKLFFTYGEKTVYFFGVDKNAVGSAISAKYDKIINPEEYLEKIFDMTFTMPEQFELSEIIKHFFRETDESSGKEYEFLIDRIAYFFKQIKFNTNPRYIKKVLNKFIILSFFKYSSDNEINLIPDISLNRKNIIYILFVLYFIILHEFYHDIFIELYNHKAKENNYANMGHIWSKTKSFTEYSQKRNISISLANNDPMNEELNRLIQILFAPTEIYKCKNNNGLYDIYSIFLQYIPSNKDNYILIDFISYLEDNRKEIVDKFNYLDNIWNLFKMSEMYL